MLKVSYHFDLRQRTAIISEFVHKIKRRTPSFSMFRYTDLRMEEYQCPVLKGCTVCVTGLSTVERKEVQRLCELYGGSYTGQLKMNECTHLIVNEPSGGLFDFHS